MKIIVCVKVVSDPEAPVSTFKVDEQAKRVVPPPGTPPVLNPFDENALEAALKIKDLTGASITILSMGASIPKPVIRKSLATGADNLVLLEDDAFEGLDSSSTAILLARAIGKLGPYDLILCGREAADTDAGQTGLIIAEVLRIPAFSLATRIVATANAVQVERLTASGRETTEIATPALVTVSSEVGTLRTAKLPGIMAAQKKPVTTWKAADLAANRNESQKVALRRLFQPVRNTKCEIVSGGSPEESGARLAQQLRNIKAL